LVVVVVLWGEKGEEWGPLALVVVLWGKGGGREHQVSLVVVVVYQGQARACSRPLARRYSLGALASFQGHLEVGSRGLSVPALVGSRVVMAVA
jgi:hypothetical protein